MRKARSLLYALFGMTLLGAAPAGGQGLVSSTEYECEQVATEFPVTCEIGAGGGYPYLEIRIDGVAAAPGLDERRLAYMLGVLTENFLARGGVHVQKIVRSEEGSFKTSSCHVPRQTGRVWCGSWKALTPEDAGHPDHEAWQAEQSDNFASPIR